MKLEYKKLGDYIQLVDERNRNLEVETLLGVSIRKVLMPSIANTIGTDMSTYKIIRKNQFAYGTVTSRNGDKISIALLKEFDKALVSQIYLVFEVIDETVVHPDYLMMWFRRPEFDRYARFKSHGSARETFDWAEMLETELPIPSLEKQKELIEEYEAVENRIQLNKKLCATLEETAQTIYKHWFEDFEFPVSRHCEEEGTTDEAIPSVGYKSSGGEMVECEELGKEIPKGWRIGKLEEISEKLYGFPFNSNLFNNTFDGIQLIRIRDIINNYSNIYSSEEVDDKYLIQEKDLLIGMDGTFHITIWSAFKALLNQRVVRFRMKDESNFTSLQLYFSIKQQIKYFENNIQGTTVAHLSDKNVQELSALIGDEKCQFEISKIFNKFSIRIINASQQTQKLEELKSLLLGKMAVEV